MVEITTTEISTTVNSDKISKSYPKNSIRFDIHNGIVYLKDTPTDRKIAYAKIEDIVLNGVQLNELTVINSLIAELYV